MSVNEDTVTLALLASEVDALRANVERLEKSVSGLVDAWNAAGTFIKAVKLLSTIIAAAGAIWLFIKTGKAG